MIVGWDTSTGATAAAVLRADGESFERRDDPVAGQRPAHTSRLLELVEGSLDDAGLNWEAITGLAVGVGPGGFTGLRIGIATARALAQAHDLPVHGVSSLEALAAAALTNTGGGCVLAVIDARRGQAFAAAWGPRRMPLSPAAALEPEQLETLTAGLPAPPLAVGDGAVKFRAELERAGALVPPDDSPAHLVSAAQICRLGQSAEPTARDDLVPDYCREPDATPRQP